jgi:hypothetical protein
MYTVCMQRLVPLGPRDVLPHHPKSSERAEAVKEEAMMSLPSGFSARWVGSQEQHFAARRRTLGVKQCKCSLEAPLSQPKDYCCGHTPPAWPLQATCNKRSLPDATQAGLTP